MNKSSMISMGVTVLFLVAGGVAYTNQFHETTLKTAQITQIKKNNRKKQRQTAELQRKTKSFSERNIEKKLKTEGLTGIDLGKKTDAGKKTLTDVFNQVYGMKKVSDYKPAVNAMKSIGIDDATKYAINEKPYALQAYYYKKEHQPIPPMVKNANVQVASGGLNSHRGTIPYLVIVTYDTDTKTNQKDIFTLEQKIKSGKFSITKAKQRKSALGTAQGQGE